MQFDHPCKEMSFYNKEIDGRFRISINDKIRMYKKWKIKMYKIVQK